jgi:hypothetical protein
VLTALGRHCPTQFDWWLWIPGWRSARLGMTMGIERPEVVHGVVKGEDCA